MQTPSTALTAAASGSSSGSPSRTTVRVLAVGADDPVLQGERLPRGARAGERLERAGAVVGVLVAQEHLRARLRRAGPQPVEREHLRRPPPGAGAPVVAVPAGEAPGVPIGLGEPVALRGPDSGRTRRPGRRALDGTRRGEDMPVPPRRPRRADRQPGRRPRFRPTGCRRCHGRVAPMQGRYDGSRAARSAEQRTIFEDCPERGSDDRDDRTTVDRAGSRPRGSRVLDLPRGRRRPTAARRADGCTAAGGGRRRRARCRTPGPRRAADPTVRPRPRWQRSSARRAAGTTARARRSARGT